MSADEKIKTGLGWENQWEDRRSTTKMVPVEVHYILTK